MSTVKTKLYAKNNGSQKVEQIFKDLREAIDGLERIIRGQGEINGTFYAVLDSVLDELKVPSKRKDKRGYDEISLKQARVLVDAVPAIDPPGCIQPDGSPNN